MENKVEFKEDLAVRARITVSLWPRSSLFPGKRTSGSLIGACQNPVLLNLEIADAELLAAEWDRTPERFEQEGARSIRAALHEREVAISSDDRDYLKKEGSITRECLSCLQIFDPDRNPKHSTWSDAFCSRRCEGDYYYED